MKNFFNSVTGRGIVLSFLTLVFLIPLNMVRGVVQERNSYHQRAVSGIAQSWAGSQLLVGPLLILPYTIEVDDKVEDKQTGTIQIKTRRIQRSKYIIPERLDINADLQVEERSRGIYEVPVYRADVKMKGYFKFDNFTVRDEGRFISYGAPYLSVGISDMRGIGANAQVLYGGAEHSIQAGSSVGFIDAGLHVDLPQNITTSKNTEFDIRLSLKGMDAFRVIPVGRNTRLKTTSPWQHPSFGGYFLPSTRQVSEEGFEAEWESGILATDAENIIGSCQSSSVCSRLWDRDFAVRMYSPVDVYSSTERAVKYGVLFISLTFSAFFFFEILKEIKIHPVQYGLLGGALSLFYLLLLSLSEHFSFSFSYGAAVIAVSGLLGYYVGAVLKNIKTGFVFGGFIAVLYGILYFILRSEDYALLFGTALLFVVLSAAMVLTRNINWYTLGKKDVVKV